MKMLIVVTAVSLAASGVAAAQEAPRLPLSRGDLQVVVGWQNLHREQPQPQSHEWINSIIYGSAGAGWYWTDHLKTQVDLGTGSEGHQYRYETIVVNGQPTALSSRVSVRQQSVAIGQHYQFFRNRWFHPHLGAGAAIAREITTETYNPVYVFDSLTRISREITAARSEGPEHRTLARPFAEGGFKAYMTRRAFFAADARALFKGDLDEVLFRFGFGVDF